MMSKVQNNINFLYLNGENKIIIRINFFYKFQNLVKIKSIQLLSSYSKNNFNWIIY